MATPTMPNGPRAQDPFGSHPARSGPSENLRWENRKGSPRCGTQQRAGNYTMLAAFPMIGCGQYFTCSQKSVISWLAEFDHLPL